MALRMAELGVGFSLLHTATGNELPGVREHIERVARGVKAPLIDIGAPTLGELIDEQQCIPNFQRRFCTRMIKIEPVSEWLSKQPLRHVLCVGLRADEEGRAGGTYDCDVMYPLRDWGWNEADVISYIEAQGFVPPARTDCAVCFYQTLHEWFILWRDYPEQYAQGEAWEKQIGHTFRSPARDTRPAALVDLRQCFEQGYRPKRRRRKITCRVCST